MTDNTYNPKFVSVVAIVLGCLDLISGFMHTILLEFAAMNITGIDLSTQLVIDFLPLASRDDNFHLEHPCQTLRDDTLAATEKL